MNRTGHGRRTFLATVGSAGLVSITGCSFGQDGGDTPTVSPTPPSTSPGAVDDYEVAIEILVEIKATLDEWAESSFEPDMVATLKERVRSAQEALTRAEEAADQSGDLPVQINQAKRVATFQQLSLAYYEAINEFNQFVSEASNLAENGFYQRAADTFAVANERLDRARAVIGEMDTTLDEIDTEALGESELEYGGEPLDHLDLEDRRTIDATERYGVAYGTFYLAFVHVGDGQDRYENEEYSDAREAWETGRQRAIDSKTAFEDTIANEFTPSDLQEDAVNRMEDAETLIEAFDEFVEGAQEAEDGDLDEADSHIDEGYDILDQLPFV